MNLLLLLLSLTIIITISNETHLYTMLITNLLFNYSKV